jgi:diguanylate cyclase (GGDEF)-like protein
MGVIFAAHALLIAISGQSALTASRLLTAALVAVTAICIFWRAALLPARERPTWMWAGTGVLLWAAAHALEAFIGHSQSGSVLTIDASDFIYLCAIFPLLMAFATTRETQSLRAVFLLNCAQIGLALLLGWFMLYRMALSPDLAATIMGRIYGLACILIAVMSLLRIFSWSTQEERQAVRWISVFLWTYMPVELGMNYLTQYRGLKAGTLLDLAWSVPFGIAGWKALTLPLALTAPESRAQTPRGRLLVECACPLLLNAGIFALAAAVMRQHVVLGLVTLAALLLIQGLQAAMVQMNYLAGRNLLLDREQQLRSANLALEKLALRDPLTGIANRRRFDAVFDAASRRAQRRRHPLALLLVDIDYFKGINDTFGHGYGDECLVKVAHALAQQARRPDDLVARLGGEEFVLLLPDTTEDGAVALADRLREAVFRLGIVNHVSPFQRRLTVSVGVAVWFPTSDVAPASLTVAADRALYQAKDEGRNRTCAILLNKPEPAGQGIR